jgi:hypothetical protein
MTPMALLDEVVRRHTIFWDSESRSFVTPEGELWTMALIGGIKELWAPVWAVRKEAEAFVGGEAFEFLCEALCIHTDCMRELVGRLLRWQPPKEPRLRRWTATTYQRRLVKGREYRRVKRQEARDET